MTSPRGARPFDDWADIYDRVYAGLDHDIPFYVQQAIASGGPVLELGCGTGRVALAMLEAGVDVVGVDISPRMVEVAQTKALERGLAERAHFEVGDMRLLRLSERFALVTIPFRGLLLLTSADDQRAALATAAAHLMPDGMLALDVFNPDPALLADTDDERFVESIVPQLEGGSVIVYATNRWDHAAQLSTPRLWIEERDAEGVVQATHERDFAMRYVWPDEMAAMLADAGFEVEARFGGFDGEPVTEDCDDLAWVAKAPGVP